MAEPQPEVQDGWQHRRPCCSGRFTRSVARCSASQRTPTRLELDQCSRFTCTRSRRYKRRAAVTTTCSRPGPGRARAWATSCRSWTKVLREGSGRGIRAIVVYPMNALANSQEAELEEVPYCRICGRQRPGDLRPVHRSGVPKRNASESLAEPPDILLTNYVMLELILTRRRAPTRSPGTGPPVPCPRRTAHIATSRCRRHAPVSEGPRGLSCRTAPVRRYFSHACGEGTLDEQREQVALLAGRLFGTSVRPGARNRRDT